MHALASLEYQALIEAIVNYAHTSGGTAILRKLRPQTELAKIQERRPLLQDMLRLRETMYDLPVADVQDMASIFRNAAPEDAILPPEELLSCLTLLETATAIKEFALEDCIELTEISNLCNQIDDCPKLRTDLARSIDRDGSILDNASPELRALRIKAMTLEARIQRHLEQMLHSSDWEGSLQEHFVTMRNGRYVVPVKKDSRAALKGIVHDLSNSGQTVFVEPSETLGMGNELSRTRLEERDEVMRILAALSKQVRLKLDALRQDLNIISELDACWAIACWAANYGCVLPDFGNELKLSNARHPLLQMQFAQETPTRRVIPLNLFVTRNIKAIAITGSNTGGKTVVLKTVGLLCLAAQSGLPVPVSPDSQFTIFDNVLADIGDGQSLQQSLSTFSAHVANICGILNATAEPGRYLVLLDELGSGTDPVEGGALACGILRNLAKRNALSLVTTHLALVKNFVHSRRDMLNAAVRFNVETLQPEYELEVGRPGASHALLIARRLGMPENVLKEAQQMLSGDQIKLEDMLTRMEADQRKIASHANKMADAASELEAKKEALRLELEGLRKQRRELLLDAHRQAEALVENTRREMENLVRQIRENAKQGGTKPDLEAEENARRAIEERRRKLSRGMKMHDNKPREALKQDELKPGLRVWVEKLQADGTVERLFGGNKVSVNVNGLSFTMNSEDISRAHGTVEPKTEEPVVKVMLPVAQGRTPSELNLVGMRVEDALQKLEEYLDRSGMARLNQVTIVHGFGSGRLRNAIHQFLLTSPLVQDFKLTKDNGGSTDVVLKS